MTKYRYLVYVYTLVPLAIEMYGAFGACRLCLMTVAMSRGPVGGSWHIPFCYSVWPSKFNGVMLRYIIFVTVYYRYMFIVIHLVCSNLLYNRLLYIVRLFNLYSVIEQSIVLIILR